MTGQRKSVNSQKKAVKSIKRTFPVMIKSLMKNKTALAYLLLSLTCFFWAGNFVMGRAVISDVPPVALSFWRWFFASLFILPFAWHHLKKDWPTIKPNLPYFAALGLLGGATYNALTYIALHTTTANNAFILNASIALMIVIANALINKIRPGSGQILAIFIAMIGMVYIITEGNLANLKTFRFKTGDILVVITIIGWALYTALLPKRPATHSLSFAALTFIAATLWLIPPLLIEHVYYKPLAINAISVGSILFAAVFPALLAYLFYNKGVELIGGNRAGVTIYLIPFFGAILSYIFLNEIPHQHHYIGFTLILAGVVLSALKKDKQ